MSAPPEIIAVVRQWVQMAENDLITAEHTLTLKQTCPYEAVCFHAQQCAEKYLKALLLSRAIEFPKIHDLRVLIQLMPPEVNLGLDLEELFSLNRYAIVSRYPGDYEELSREEAEQAVAVARKVKDAVRAILTPK